MTKRRGGHACAGGAHPLLSWQVARAAHSGDGGGGGACRAAADRLWGRFHVRSRPRGLSRSHKREALVTGHLTGRRSGSMLWSSAIAVAAAPRAVHFLHRGEGGGRVSGTVPAANAPTACVWRGCGQRAATSAPPAPAPTACIAVPEYTKKKKRTPPAYNPATRPHPAAHTRHTTKRTSNHHPTPTSDTSHPASVHPCAHSRGSAARHHPAVPPAARQRTCTTALAAGVSNDRGSHRLPHQPGPSQQPTSRILVPTARFRRPTDSNTAVRPHDAPSARPLFTRFRPPANPGHRAPPTPRPPRVQGGHTLTAGRRRRPLI